ncbi:MAG: DNA repair protein RecO [Gemmatimonadales bacterium]|nr:DNA repair protein RecO [Gemmatimonadales bacterium]MBP6570379.1 DNA repair protein RecO [Gemmatimonadales bacterium]MBP7620891.1 DNA repair protein RecO [Gemmatimonadales bacterium]MBP9898221.1 DNA repair protein RecO [Gemmatimonadales bacterium]
MAGSPTITPAIVLGSIRYGETSRIVRLLTRDLGMLSAIAKGALRPKSRFGASLQLLSEGQAHLLQSRSGDLHTMVAFDLTGWHGGLANDMGRFHAASALAELAVRFVPPIGNPPLFDEIRQAVALIELAPLDAVEVVGLRALWRLIGDLGLGPALEHCARDGADLPEGAVAFSLGDGGFLCAACARGAGAARLAAEDRAAVVALLTPGADLPVLDAPHAAAHRRLLARWVGHHLADGELPALEAWRRTG